MFLSQLSEVEKNAFLSLSILASKANGVFAEEEKMVIQAYCMEMGIPSFDEDSAMAMEEVVKVFKEAAPRSKKIAFLELMGVVYADGEFDDAEEDFVVDFAMDIGLTEEEVNKQHDAFLAYMEAVSKVTEAIEYMEDSVTS